MQYKFAKQLHNGDEVIIKKTGEITKVISADVQPKIVLVACMSREYGYHEFTHKELG